MGRSNQETIREQERTREGFSLQGARLHVMGEGRFETIVLPREGQLVVGRDEDCEVQLEGPAISRRHAILHVGRELRIEDCGSTNGTRIGGRRIESGSNAQILPGDAIEIGGFTLALSLDGGTERPNKVWPEAYFKASAETACARASGTDRAVDVLAVRFRGAPDREVLAKVLGADLTGEEVLAEGAGPEFLVLLLARSPEVAASIQRSMVSRLAELGFEVELAMARRRSDESGAQLLERARRGFAQKNESGARGPVLADPAMERLYRMVDRVAEGSIGVLVLGETGAGKELIAEAIHQRSPRKGGPFIRLNCAALPETLFESELFGYEKGAFTGALKAKPGLIEAAHQGTLFLDEVGEMPMAIQVKLLRVLEDHRVQRVGALEPTEVDLRVVAATNRDLDQEIAAGRFRSDLYFRLNGISLVVPPLRERPSEIEPLVQRFIELAGRRDSKKLLPTVSPAALAALTAYRWPGNIRELKNVVERALVLAGPGPIEPEHLPKEVLQGAPTSVPEAAPPAVVASAAGGEQPLPKAVEAFERQQIIEALEASGGNQTQAAKRLGIARRTLINRLDEYGISRPRKPSPKDD